MTDSDATLAAAARQAEAMDTSRDMSRGNERPGAKGDAPKAKRRYRRRTGDSKRRLVWNEELHTRFVQAVSVLGVRAVPKNILRLMNVEGLTRENVASHLQKYRAHLRKLENPSGSEGAAPAAGVMHGVPPQGQHLFSHHQPGVGGVATIAGGLGSAPFGLYQSPTAAAAAAAAAAASSAGSVYPGVVDQAAFLRQLQESIGGLGVLPAGPAPVPATPVSTSAPAATAAPASGVDAILSAAQLGQRGSNAGGPLPHFMRYMSAANKVDRHRSMPVLDKDAMAAAKSRAHLNKRGSSMPMLDKDAMQAARAKKRRSSESGVPTGSVDAHISLRMLDASMGPVVGDLLSMVPEEDEEDEEAADGDEASRSRSSTNLPRSSSSEWLSLRATSSHLLGNSFDERSKWYPSQSLENAEGSPAPTGDGASYSCGFGMVNPPARMRTSSGLSMDEAKSMPTASPMHSASPPKALVQPASPLKAAASSSGDAVVGERQIGFPPTSD